MTKPIKFDTILGSKKPSEAYVAYAGDGGQEKFDLISGKAMDSAAGISRGTWQQQTFQNIRPGISGRPGFGRDDYEYFRPNEALPRRYKDMIIVCDNLYYNFTLVRNVIDLMSDFACEGIRLVHPVKSQERFYNAWFKKINGFDRSERFLNYLYRYAKVAIEARVGDLSYKQEREFSSHASDIKLEPRVVKSGELPLQYIFHNPGLVTIRENSNINSDKTLYQVEMVDNRFTNDSNINDHGPIGMTGKKRALSPEKTFVYYYKRDDWNIHAIPFLYPLIKPAIMLEKLALADMAALDGAISAVRIFKLGDVEHKIAPTEAAVAKLDEILQSHTGGGALDIIWPGPIELIESNTNVHNFLGEEKYGPALEQFYNGLGVPPTLAGKGGTGTTNNYISLKTLTKRLQYGRQLLLEFWEEQIKWVQKAMKFSRPAKVEFDFFDLGDEASEKALYVQLADRNIISDEKLQSMFNLDGEMEKARLNRESRERKSGRRVEKPTALNDTFTPALMKIALQKGYVTPEQAGLKVDEIPAKGKTPFDKQIDVMKEKAKNPAGPAGVGKKGKSTRGRPTGAKDGAKRKQKAFKPKIKAALDIWVDEAQNKINDIIKVEFLKNVSKSNFRQLTQKEVEYYEKLIFGVLCSLEPMCKVTKAVVIEALEVPADQQLFRSYLDYTIEVAEELNRELTLDETRKIKSIIYSSLHNENL